jgi:hypothetical protein
MSDAKGKQPTAGELQHALDDLRLIVWRLQVKGTGIGVPPNGVAPGINVNNNHRACAPSIGKSDILEIFKRVTDRLA